MIPADTSTEAFQVQALCFRRLGRDERLRRAMELCDEMRDLCAGSVRRRHPQFDEAQVRAEVGRIVVEVASKLA